MTNDDLISRRDALRAIRHWLLYEKSTKTPCEVLSEMPSAQPDLCDGCDRYGASCVGEGCGKLEMPEVAKDTNVPINDCISRQAVIDEITEYGSGDDIFMSVGELKRRIEHLPSAQPDLSEYSDKLWRNAYERGKAEAVRKGKWLHNPDDTAGEPYYICSKCGHGSYDITKFCPYCGSLNGGD